MVLVHRLREVMALVGFTRFEPAGTDEKGELDLDGIAPAALSPEPEWFPAVENGSEGVLVALSAEAISAGRESDGVRRRGTQFLAGKLAWDRERPGSDLKLLDMPYIMLPSLSHLLLTRIPSTVVTRRRPCASAATRYRCRHARHSDPQRNIRFPGYARRPRGGRPAHRRASHCSAR